MRNDERAGEHIWLRQAVRFTVGDQRRTLEIAIPVPVGAPTDEIERLLRQASEGMERLTRHLDDRVAALTDGLAATRAVDAGHTEPPEVPSTSGEMSASTLATAEIAPATLDVAQPATAQVPAHAREPEQPPTQPHEDGAQRPTQAARGATESAPTRTPQAAPQPARPEPVRPTTPAAGASSRPTSSTPGSQPPVAARPTAASALETSAPDLTRRDFLAETTALGLNPRQVMERLGVRSLDGLNLREALEVLRRQMVRDTGVGDVEPSVPADMPAAPASPRAAVAPVSAPATAGKYFEEEDDFDISFALPDEDPTDMDLVAGQAAEPGSDAFADDDLADLDDVPDFGQSTPPAAVPAPARRAAPASRTASTQSAAPTPGDAVAASGPLSLPQRARARDLMARLRATPAGGTPTRGQLTAYANIIVDQLGAATAAALVQGLWGTRVDRLGTDQLNALIQWGKDDEFAVEAPAVAAALQAERAAAEAGNGAAPTRPARSARPGGPQSTGAEPGSVR